jgi:hypothetical protein
MVIRHAVIIFKAIGAQREKRIRVFVTMYHFVVAPKQEKLVVLWHD